jgi:hypothetical protein
MGVAVKRDVRVEALRCTAVWAVLLAAAQAADVMTSAVDMARGTVESTAATAQLLDWGGLALMLAAKLLVAGAAAAVLRPAALRVRHGAGGAHITFRLALAAVQAGTIAVVWTALNNVALLSSLTS